MLELQSKCMIVSLVLIAGCSGGVGGGLEIAAQDADTTAFGNVVITVTVENTAQEPREGSVFCEVDVGGRVYEQSEFVTVGSESRTTIQLEYDIPLSDYGEGGEYRCQIG